MLAALALGMTLCTSLPAGPAPAWLAGRWVEERPDGGWTEERWSPPRGGVMLGTNLSGAADNANAFEFMRIARDEDGMAFWGSPGKASPVRFALTRHVRDNGTCTARASFENPTHEYPTRVEYAREGETLTATVSGPDGANPMRWVFRRAE